MGFYYFTLLPACSTDMQVCNVCVWGPSSSYRSSFGLQNRYGNVWEARPWRECSQKKTSSNRWWTFIILSRQWSEQPVLARGRDIKKMCILPLFRFKYISGHFSVTLCRPRKRIYSFLRRLSIVSVDLAPVIIQLTCLDQYWTLKKNCALTVTPAPRWILSTTSADYCSFNVMGRTLEQLAGLNHWIGVSPSCYT